MWYCQIRFVWDWSLKYCYRWTSTDSIYGSRALAKDWENKVNSVASGLAQNKIIFLVRLFSTKELGEIFWTGQHAFVPTLDLDWFYLEHQSLPLAFWPWYVRKLSQTEDIPFYRIDIFVLLDLIGAGDMSFMKLESSTGEERSKSWWTSCQKPWEQVTGTIGWWQLRGIWGAPQEVCLAKQSSRCLGSILDQSSRNVSGSPSWVYHLLSVINILLQDAARIPSGIEDDHIPFKRRGVPILHLISVPFPKASWSQT